MDEEEKIEHEINRENLMKEIAERFLECGYDEEGDKEEANDLLDLLDIYAPCLLLHPIPAGEFLRTVLDQKMTPDIGGLVRLQKDFEESRRLGYEVKAAQITMAALKKELADE